MNYLIIMADEYMAGAMSCAGHPVVRTPNLDRLAARGTRFTNAYTPSPMCVPARAAFQTAAVGSYLADASIPKPPADTFNSSNRAFPDIATLGNNILILQGGQWQITGGTSASAPIFAGILALLNDHLAQNGKQPVGFVSPFLYHLGAKCPACFKIIGDLDSRGAWVEAGRLRYHGDDDPTREVIRSETFMRNLEELADWLGAEAP